MTDEKRKIIREKIAKRTVIEDIPFGYPESNKSHGRITEPDKKNIQDMRDYVLKKLENERVNN